MADSLLTLYPAHWRSFTLGQLCARGDADVQVGVRVHPDPEQDEDAGVPYVMPKNLRNNRIESEKAIARASNLNEKQLQRYRIRRGDILCSRRGELNRCAVVGPQEEGWLCGSDCLRLRFNGNMVNPQFAYYYFNHPIVCAWINRHAVGATLPNINESILCSMPFIIPPLAEQEKIAGILGALDQKIALNSATNQNLLETSRCLFQLLTEGWVPGAPVPAVAKNVPHARLRTGVLQDCCNRIENGRTPSRSEHRFWNGTIPWLTSSEIRNPVITSAETFVTQAGQMECNLRIWPRGATVVAMFGATAGQVALLGLDASANQACCGLVPRTGMQYYVHLHMVTFANVLQNLSKGSAQQNLNQRTIAEFPILIPDDSTLNEFEGKVRPLFENVIGNIRESATLIDLKKSVLPMLFSGDGRGVTRENTAYATRLLVHA